MYGYNQVLGHIYYFNMNTSAQIDDDVSDSRETKSAISVVDAVTARQVKHRIIGGSVLATFLMALIFAIVKTSSPADINDEKTLPKADTRQSASGKILVVAPYSPPKEAEATVPEAASPAEVVSTEMKEPHSDGSDRKVTAVVPAKEISLSHPSSTTERISVKAKLAPNTKLGEAALLTGHDRSDSVVIQVAAVSSLAKAKEVQNRLEKAGFKATLQPIKTSKGMLVRIKVGPFKSVKQAEAANARLRKIGLAGVFVS